MLKKIQKYESAEGPNRSITGLYDDIEQMGQNDNSDDDIDVDDEDDVIEQ